MASSLLVANWIIGGHHDGGAGFVISSANNQA
jgi:hypothetical protein